MAMGYFAKNRQTFLDILQNDILKDFAIVKGKRLN